jgi:hypothetical protein
MTAGLRLYVLARVALGLLLIPFDHPEHPQPFIQPAPPTQGVRGRR